MVKIEQRLKEFTYDEKGNYKSNDVIFFICDELKTEDFKSPFFNSKQIINLSSGFKFLSYCGKEQNKNFNKNALVIEKKISKKDKIIYRAYLMNKENFNILDLFLEKGIKDTIGEHNGYNLDPKHYLNSIKGTYTKKEMIFIINQILEVLTNWSLTKR